MDYQHVSDGVIQTSIPVEGTEHELIIRASNVRMQRTGVHATVTIAIDSTVIEEDALNVESRDQRNRMANSAASSGVLTSLDIAPRLPKEDMQLHLLHFCRGLWRAMEGEYKAQYIGGIHDRTPPPWLVEPYILRGAGTILFAPPGRGKSWLTMLMAVALDNGKGFPFTVKEKARVMYINLERSEESLSRRLGDVNQALDLPRERPLLRMDRRGRTLAQIWAEADYIRRTEGVQVIFLDSLSRAGFGLVGDEDANKGVDLLNAFGCAWVAIGHTPRGDEGHVFGSQMFTAAADLEVQLLTEPKDEENLLGIGTKGVKANDVKAPGLDKYALRFDSMGLLEIRRARPGEFLQIENASQPRDIRNGGVKNAVEEYDPF